jgi:hypothetical protein
MLIGAVTYQGDLMELAYVHPYGSIQRKKARVVYEDYAGLSSQPSGDPMWTSKLSKEMADKKVKNIYWFKKILHLGASGDSQGELCSIPQPMHHHQAK